MGLFDRLRRLRSSSADPFNRGEGHLGGYIRARPSDPASALQTENGDPATWSPGLWIWAVDRLGVRSVLDVGCGEGVAARHFRELGCEAVGVDGSREAFRDSRIPDAHVVHDFTEGPYDPGREFDLVWSCEFVEHVEARFEPHFLQTFQAARYVMMTYAEPGQPGWHHVNCQNGPYWAYRLYQYGFELDRELTDESRALSDGYHYSQRGLLFRRMSAGGPSGV